MYFLNKKLLSGYLLNLTIYNDRLFIKFDYLISDPTK